MRPLLVGTLVVLFGGVLAIPSLAQNRASAADSLVLTADDVRPGTTGCSIVRRYAATLDEGASARDSARFENAVGKLVEGIGSGGPYDLAQFPFTPADSGVAFTRPLSALSELPGAASARSRGARYASVSTLSEGGHLVEYFDVEADGLYDYSSVLMTRRKRSYEPTVRNPPLRGLKLPSEVGATWAYEERRFAIVGAGILVIPGDTTRTVVRDLRMPVGDDSLRLHTFYDATGTDGARVVGQVQSGVYELPRIGYWSEAEMRTRPAPEGYTTHCAYLGGELPVSFPVPTDWTVMNLHGKSPATHSVSISRDPAAIDSLRSASTEISTSARMHLGTPDNAIISLAVFGMDDEPDEYLRGLRVGSLNDAEVTRSVSRREVRGRTAYEKQWRGTGARGQALASTHVAFRAADLLFELTVYRPAERPLGSDEVLQAILDRLTVGE